MQLFQCSQCWQPIYFDNTQCTSCGALLGFDAQQMKMVALRASATAQDAHTYFECQTGQAYYFCQNYQEQVCNWVIARSNTSANLFCQACRLNRVIPDLADLKARLRWKKIETAKHHLIYALLQWRLPLHNKLQQPDTGLAFDFKATNDLNEMVLTGHMQGVITLNIAEADDIEREMAKNSMAELYRSVLGHFRHEIGHYYWDVLVAKSDCLSAFRQLFGNEQVCYQQELHRHYQQGAPLGWRDSHISAYATMHPWEDWAETWAHYLHIVDVLETAETFGIQIQPNISSTMQALHLPRQQQNPYFCDDFEQIYQAWLPVAFAMNSLNRSMGQNDFYPFLINPKVKEKLRFVHQVIHQQYNDIKKPC